MVLPQAKFENGVRHEDGLDLLGICNNVGFSNTYMVACYSEHFGHINCSPLFFSWLRSREEITEYYYRGT